MVFWKVDVSWLRDRVRSSDIGERLRVEPLLLRVERSQLSGSGIWLGCLLDVSLGRCFRHDCPGRDTGADQGHDGEMISPG